MPKEDLPRGFTRLFISLALVNLLGAMDISIVATALPVMVGEFHQTQNMAWVIVGYSLAIALMVPIYGKLADKFGSSRLFGWAIGVFLAASVICGLSTNIYMLAIARVFQGFGGGGLGILPLTILSGVLPERTRPKYMAPLASVWAIAAIGGPVLGGILTDTVGWRWIFFINVPLGILALVLANGALPKATQQHKEKLFDFSTWAFFGSFAVLLIFTMHNLAEDLKNGLAAQTIYLGIATVIAAALWVWSTLRSDHPVIPLRILRNRGAVTILVIGTVCGTNLFAISGFVPSALQMGFGMPATLAGLGLVPMVLVMVTTSILSSRRVAHTGAWRHLPIIGTAIGTLSMTVAFLFMQYLNGWVIILCLAATASGLGLIGQLPLTLVQSFSKAKVFGAVTATVNVARDLTGSLVSTISGGIFGFGVVSALSKLQLPNGIVASAVSPHNLQNFDAATRIAVNQAYIDGFRPIFLNSALAYGFALVLAISMPKLQLKTKN